MSQPWYAPWWYGAVTMLFVIVGVYTLVKCPDRKLVAVYTFLSGLTYASEFFVLVVFRAYEYRPGVLGNAYFDNILGAVVSDAFSIPASGTLVAAFNVGWKGMLALIATIVGIEVAFIRVAIYEHYWWKFYCTAIGLVVWFLLAKDVYRRLRSKVTTWLRFAILVCTNLLLQASTVFVLVAFFNAYRYEIGWFWDKTRGHVAFATVYIFFLSLIFSTLVTLNIGLFWRVATVILLTPIDWTLLEYGILRMSSHWSLAHFVILRIILLEILVVFNRVVLSSGEPDPSLLTRE